MATGYVAEVANAPESKDPASKEPASKDHSANEPLVNKKVVGFSAVEIYSRKLSEIQCLAVADGYQGNGIGSALVKACVEHAREKGILEVMAISASDGFLRQLGFDYSLPEQKRALFCELHSRDEIFKDEIEE